MGDVVRKGDKNPVEGTLPSVRIRTMLHPLNMWLTLIITVVALGCGCSRNLLGDVRSALMGGFVRGQEGVV